MLDKII